ncbi:hypothetical protein [Eisenbergiella tayi]|uniref:hypothetical protein n=1 Tax=Eisenbergiella tayi TaxID=1432052 RepID=UPI00084915F5|nr:hypothetical protein [Eisenbergiella tayi]ODR28308.1 hypothetical protein BEI60_31260 [Eisenbergiella tayi]
MKRIFCICLTFVFSIVLMNSNSLVLNAAPQTNDLSFLSTSSIERINSEIAIPQNAVIETVPVISTRSVGHISDAKKISFTEEIREVNNVKQYKTTSYLATQVYQGGSGSGKYDIAGSITIFWDAYVNQYNIVYFKLLNVTGYIVDQNTNPITAKAFDIRGTISDSSGYYDLFSDGVKVSNPASGQNYGKVFNMTTYYDAGSNFGFVKGQIDFSNNDYVYWDWCIQRGS